jgi:hypothetical protein
MTIGFDATTRMPGIELAIVMPDGSVQRIAKFEDTPASDGDPGVPALAVRDSTLMVSQSAELDYGWIKVDAQGRLWVRNDVLEQRFDALNFSLGQILNQLNNLSAAVGGLSTAFS